MEGSAQHANSISECIYGVSTQYAYTHMGVKHANSILECVYGVSTDSYAVCVYTYGLYGGVISGVSCIYAVCVYTYGLYRGVISGVSCSTTQYAYTQMGYMEE